MRDDGPADQTEQKRETSAALERLDTINKEAVEAHEAARQIHEILFADPYKEDGEKLGVNPPAGFFGRLNVEENRAVERLREINAVLREIIDRL